MCERGDVPTVMVNFTENDEGKPVLLGDEKVGVVTRVEGGTAYVDPDTGITDKIKSMLDWGEPGEDTYPLPEQRVDAVTDDEIRLQHHV